MLGLGIPYGNFFLIWAHIQHIHIQQQAFSSKSSQQLLHTPLTELKNELHPLFHAKSMQLEQRSMQRIRRSCSAKFLWNKKLEYAWIPPQLEQNIMSELQQKGNQLLYLKKNIHHSFQTLIIQCQHWNEDRYYSRKIFSNRQTCKYLTKNIKSISEPHQTLALDKNVQFLFQKSIASVHNHCH